MKRIAVVISLFAVILVLGVVCFVQMLNSDSNSGGKDSVSVVTEDSNDTARFTQAPQKQQNASASVTPSATKTEETEETGIYSHTYEDINIIPDRYNCGYDPDLEMTVAHSGDMGGINWSYSGEDEIKIDFKKNTEIEKTSYVRNIDFSQKGVRMYNSGVLQSPVTIVFENCLFSSFRGSNVSKSVKFVFNNCTFTYCSGGNLEFNRCIFSGTSKDGLVAFSNVTVNSSLFMDKSPQGTRVGAGAHTDGVQIFGEKDNDVHNVHFYNCRFEMPQLKNSTAKVNSCIMLQTEYSNGDDITFKHCYLNGGGYSIYARAVSGTKLTNAVFSDIYIGASRQYGQVCPCLNEKIDDSGVSFNNIRDTDRLYVSSVWKGEKSFSICVSNDTGSDRTLRIVTDKGTKLINVPGCPLYNELEDSFTFAYYPFDLIYEVDKDASWMVCFDITGDTEQQIRYVVFDK